MKLYKVVIFSMLFSLAYGQGFRGFFERFTRPFTDLTNRVRNLVPKPVAQLPDNEKLDKDNCRCRLGAGSRIVGGQISEAIPWQAALVDSKSTLFCGGSIVNQYYVITTAVSRI